jgi:hypothetical protein
MEIKTIVTAGQVVVELEPRLNDYECAVKRAKEAR